MLFDRATRAGRIAAASVLVALLAATARADDDGLPPPERKAPPAAPGDVDVGFDPMKDAPLFVNSGNYANPHGNCAGMALVAIANFLERQRGGLAANAPGSPVLPGFAPLRSVAGDPLEREVTSLVHERYTVKDDDPDSTPFSDPRPIREALARIGSTRTPEVLELGKGGGHAVVLFGRRDGKLLVYDPNYPGETIEWPFDPEKGLGPFPKTADDAAFYGPFRDLASVPFASFRASRDVSAIRDACTLGARECTDAFAHATFEVKRDENGRVTARGRVSGGRAEAPTWWSATGERTDPPARVFFRLDGELSIRPVDLASDGSFEADLGRPELGEGEHRVEVIIASRDGRYAGHGATSLEGSPRRGLAEAVTGTSGAGR